MGSVESFAEKEFANIIDDIKKIAKVASPPFKEDNRIAYLKELVEEIGFSENEIDNEGNLVVKEKGKNNGLIVFSAHADTVFPEETKLEINEQDGNIFCPGICDNSTGIAAQIYLMRYIKENKIVPATDVFFVFNVGEEELGNLRGIKFFFDNLEKKTLRAHICIEGHAIGRITTVAVGSHRKKVIVSGEGGHSWRDFGKSNAISTAAKIITQLSKIRLPLEPKSTFNIGTINGGTSVNSIPAKAEFTLEVRSSNKKILKRIVKRVDKTLQKFNSPETQIQTMILGERPCGTAKNKKLTELVGKVNEQLGIPIIDEPGSTDSNYPISLGLPSLTIGITNAKNTHSIKESMETAPVKKGFIQLLKIFEELQKTEL